MEAEAKAEPKIVHEYGEFKGIKTLKIVKQITPTFSKTIFNGGEAKAKALATNPEFRKFAGLE